MFLNADKLLKSTTEGGKLFQLQAVRSVTKLASDIQVTYV